MRNVFKLVCFILMMFSISISAYASSLHEQKHIEEHHIHCLNFHIVDFEDSEEIDQEKEDVSDEQHSHHCCGSSFVMCMQSFVKIDFILLKDSFSISKNQTLNSIKLDTPERPPLS